MTDTVILTGMVIKTSDVSEYDKRLVILTKERGKIVAFARGARRPKSMYIAGTRLFAFGQFALYEGRDAYSVSKIDIENYFTEIAEGMEEMCYGCYFLELADYFTRENIDGTDTLKLLYQTLRALLKKNIPNELIRFIFELKLLVINGMYPQMFECVSCGNKEATYFSASKGGIVCSECSKRTNDAALIDTSTIYTMQFIISSPIEKLYTFIVKDHILEELTFIMKRYFQLYVEKDFKSLEILNTILK